MVWADRTVTITQINTLYIFILSRKASPHVDPRWMGYKTRRPQSSYTANSHEQESEVTNSTCSPNLGIVETEKKKSKPSFDLDLDDFMHCTAATWLATNILYNDCLSVQTVILSLPSSSAIIKDSGVLSGKGGAGEGGLSPVKKQHS